MAQVQHLPTPQGDPLMQPIYLNGKEYRTTHFLHREYLVNSPHGAKYARHDSFLRLLKGLEAYALYIEQGDVLAFASHKEAMNGSTEFVELNKNKALQDAFRAVSHKALYLVSATIQVALSHHLDDVISQQLSVASNTSTARQLTGKGTLPTELAERTFQAMFSIGRLLRTPEHIVFEQAVKQALLDTGVDLQPLMIAAPAMDDIPDEHVMLEPTDLAKKLKLKDAAWVNRFLAQIGWQHKDPGQDTWQPTDAGHLYAIRHAWMRNGKTGYNWKWNVQAVRNELQRRGFLPSAPTERKAAP